MKYNKRFPILFRFAVGVLVCLGVTLLLAILHFYFPSLWVIAISAIVGLFIVYSVRWWATLFKKIHPLRVNGELGCQGVPIYKMKGKYANAYASGFANSKLTVFNERLLEICNEEERTAILMHEMGHHHYNDSFWGSVLALAIGNSIAVLANEYNGDLSSVLITALVLVFPGGMLYLWWSRWKEKRADMYAAKQLKNPNDLAVALVKLHRDLELMGFRVAKKETFITRYLTTHPIVPVREGYINRFTDSS